MKKLSLILILFTVTSTTLSPTVSYAQSKPTTEYSKITINDDILRSFQSAWNDESLNITFGEHDSITLNSPKNNYFSSSKLISNDGHTITYEFNENGDIYTLGFDTEHSKVILNGIKQFSFDSFNSASKEQQELILDKSILSKSISSMSLSNILTKYKSERCVSCGKYSPNAAPTSGYRPYSGSRSMRTEIQVGMTQSLLRYAGIALGVAASALSYGTTTVLMTALIGEFGNQVVGTWKPVYFIQKQSTHPVCYKAYRENRQYQIKKGGAVKAEHTFYYYFSNPN